MASRTRRARLLVSTLAVLALASTAEARPKVAILGLEIVADGSMDPKTTSTARLITQRLRAEARKQPGPYALAPDAERDLLEMKLLSNCSDEGRGCMSAIGQELGADLLMYGKLEVRPGSGYYVNVRLLDTRKRQMVRMKDTTIPFPSREGDRTDHYVSNLYRDLVGLPLEGILLVQVSNADSGTVSVDGEVRGTLAGGAAKIFGVPEGERLVSIDAPGFRRHDEEITVGAGQERVLGITLDRDGAAERPGGRTLEKVVFAGSVALTAGSGAVWWYYGWSELRDAQRLKNCIGTDDRVRCPEGFERFQFSTEEAQDICRVARESDGSSPQLRNLDEQCRRGQTAVLRGWIGGIATGLFAGASAYFGYKAFSGGGPGYESEPGAAGKRRERRPRGKSVQIIPQVSPDSVGAGVTIEF